MTEAIVEGHAALWSRLSARLERELSHQQFNTWIRPLRSREADGHLLLLAPNPFVMNWVKERFLAQLAALAAEYAPGVRLEINVEEDDGEEAPQGPRPGPAAEPGYQAKLNPTFTFGTYVEGKSNQLAVAAARQVAEQPGLSYNPLYIYGGVGLGKTHLMQAVGNAILRRDPQARVLYVHSERFVSDMVRALQHNTINDFKNRYRKLDALLIDDIQFFAGKDRSQEEFFHTFNALFEGQRQIIITCDRYPKEVDGLEERLQSRFGWGLTVAIEPHELETRMAIVLRKAEQASVPIPDEVAFFIAQKIRSNVRELEGALKRVIAHAHFLNRPIDQQLAREALRDLIDIQKKLVSLENIQKVVAEYFRIRGSDMQSKRRSRNVARPRQVAMSLSKELTSHSLPEIGEAFGGRDHTTVLHACRQIEKLRKQDNRMDEDYQNLLRILSS